MGDAIKKLLLMATTASFCALFAHLFVLNTAARKAAFVFAVLNELFHLIHYILVLKLKKRNIILGMVLHSVCVSCGLIDMISNIVFFSAEDVDPSDRTVMKLCCIQTSIIIILDAVCILIEFLLRREQRIRDGLGSSSKKSEKHSPPKVVSHDEDLKETTPKKKTPSVEIKSDRKKKEDDSRKEVKKSDRERSRKDHSEKDHKDRRDRDKSKSEKKDRDHTKSGRSEKKDTKSAKSAKDNSAKSKEKSHRKRSSKGDDDRKKSDKEARKKSSKKSEKSK